MSPAKLLRSTASRVHFPEGLRDESYESTPGYDSGQPPQQQQPSVPLPSSRFLSAAGTTSEWHFPDGSPIVPPPPTYGSSRGRSPSDAEVDSSRRSSDTSTNTLVDESASPNPTTPTQKQPRHSSLSYQKHPYDIQQPRSFRTDTKYTSLKERMPRNEISAPAEESEPPYGPEFDLEQTVEATAQLTHRRRGYLSNLIDLYNTAGDEVENTYETRKRESIIQATRRASKLIDPLAYDAEWELLDRDDPIVTGAKKRNLEDLDDIEKNARRQQTYKERRKERQRIRVEYNLCCKCDFLSLFQ